MRIRADDVYPSCSRSACEQTSQVSILRLQKSLSFISIRQQQEEGTSCAFWERSGSNPGPWGTEYCALPSALGLAHNATKYYPFDSEHSLDEMARQQDKFLRTENAFHVRGDDKYTRSVYCFQGKLHFFPENFLRK